MESIRDRQILQSYIPLVKFIADVIGEHCEVLLHDLSNLDHSIIAIENGHLSGRSKGSSLTNLALNILNKEMYKGKDYIVNYEAVGRNGKKFRASSFYIKNEAQKIIGMLCVNVDIDDMLRVKTFFEKMTNFSNNSYEELHKEEVKSIAGQLDNNPDDLVETLIEQVLQNYHIPPKRMGICEKLAVVRQLQDAGVFLLKGGVSEVAKALETSEPTIYRYLTRLKDGIC